MTKPNLPMQFTTCPECGGRGNIQVISGGTLRLIRLKAGISLRELARRTRFSATYVSDVELDRRRPNQALLDTYQELMTTEDTP